MVTPRRLTVLVAAFALLTAVAGCDAGSFDTGTTPTDTDTAIASPSPAATAPGAPAPSAAPSTPAPAVPADPCHVSGVAYCVLNPDVTQATIGSTICVPGWTASIRPPESYTEELKREQIAAEGLPGPISQYEEDHRMPLELGGAPRDPGNLSPEYPRSPNPKDSDETSLKDAVCSGSMSLTQAQQQLVQTWLAPYPGYLR